MEIILLVCLIAVPDQCKEEALSLSLEPIAPMRCVMNASPMIAEWAGMHPKWRVARWRCGPPGGRGQQI